MHVEHQAARRNRPRARQKFLRGGADLGPPARASDQRLQRFAHRNIVVDDEHDGGDARHGAGPPTLRWASPRELSNLLEQSVGIHGLRDVRVIARRERVLAILLACKGRECH